jgi:NADPH:quinone reductase-like Zn-dependent oxidoreductase
MMTPMRAAIHTELGQVPVVGEFNAPTVGPGQAVVSVALAGLNPVDRLRAEGYDYLGVSTPFVSGREGVGTVDGRRVYFHEAVEPYGSFAEYALVEARELLTVPDGLTDEQAIPLGIAGLTAWTALTHEAKVAEGERVLVTGATGMVGQIAVQGARLLAASYVVAAGRHEETLSSLLERGADAVAQLDGDPGAAIAAVAGEGFDVVIDCVFGEPFAAALAATRPGARAVVVGLTAGDSVRLEFFSLYRRHITGLQLAGVPVEIRQQAFDTMAAHMLAGRLHVETELFELDKIADAWDVLCAGAHRKVMIVP